VKHDRQQHQATGNQDCALKRQPILHVNDPKKSEGFRRSSPHCKHRAIWRSFPPSNTSTIFTTPPQIHLNTSGFPRFVCVLVPLFSEWFECLGYENRIRYFSFTGTIIAAP